MLALLGSLSHTSSGDAQFDAGAPVLGATHSTTSSTSVPRPPTPPALSVAGRRPPVTAAQARLQKAMTKGSIPAGPNSGMLVYDLSAHEELFALRPSVGRPPASVEKLWTTVALMLKLGPDERFHTTLLGKGHLSHGVWHGNLYLRGGGDPTFGDQQFNSFWNHGFGPTPNQITTDLLRAGIHRVTGRLFADESLFDRHRGGLMTNFKADLPDFAGELSALTYDHGTTLPHYSPATFAVHELALTMRGSGVKVRAAPHAARTPPGSRLLATVTSPPLSVMVRLMDVPSDDLFAELFTKQLGVLFGHGGTIPDGARVMSDTIDSTYGLKPRILDGSGLSRDDRTSPVQIVDLLRETWHSTEGRELAAALPTVGREGTVQGIGVKTAAAGRCIAKTGTLDYVTNLAGLCHARDGHMLAFGIFIDGPSNPAGIAIEDQLIADVARY